MINTQIPNLAVLSLIFCGALNAAAMEQAQNAGADTLEDEYVVASLGDSITRAFNARAPLDRPSLSWSTGWQRSINASPDTYVRSHADRLQATLGVPVRRLNVARTGAVSGDLKRQADRLQGYKVDYATILIGANDLCTLNLESTDMSDIANNVENAVITLIERNPEVKILLAGIPDMMRLKAIGSGTSCQRKWDSTGICKALLHSRVSADESAFFALRWADANQKLREVASRYPANIRLADGITKYRFEREHISELDCFHPNVKGQNLISEKSWEEGWFLAP
jgi:lysophospholipase L1-like esterase